MERSEKNLAGSSASVRIGYSLRRAVRCGLRAAVAQLVECVLGKDEVTGSNPVSSLGAWHGLVSRLWHCGLEAIGW